MTAINSNVARRAARILKIAKEMAENIADKRDRCSVLNMLESISLHYDGFGEPGYNVGKSGLVALGNWNVITRWVKEANGPGTQGEHRYISFLPTRISNIFDKMGIECHWQDQWISCADCGKLVRTDADCYSWQASYIEVCGEVQCHECVKSDPEEHLTRLEGDYKKANTISDINPADFGYIKLQDCETGWHDAHDNPRDVVKEVVGHGIERWLFNIDYVEQFRTGFSLWVHSSEYETLNEEGLIEEGCSV